MRGFELQGAAGGGADRGVIVDHQLEGAEMAARRLDPALEDGEVVEPRRGEVAGVGEQHGDVEPAGKLPRGVDRRLVPAVDQRRTLRDQRHRRGRRDLQRRLGQERGHLGQRALGLVGPAGALANIGVGDHGLGVAVGPHFLEQRRFLGAGDQHRLVADDRALEIAELGPAQLALDRGLAAAKGGAQRLAVDRHGVLAIADEHRLAVELHRLSVPPGLSGPGASSPSAPRPV
jgi:hypothetical protein